MTKVVLKPKILQVNFSTEIRSLPPLLPIPPAYFQYTVANYLFAHSIDPDNEDLRTEIALASERVHKGEHTVPSTIAKELVTNPFMRAHEPALQARTGLGEGTSTAGYLGRIRQMKNAF